MSKLIDDLEEQFAPIAHEYSLRMELVEACDWDEDAALELFEKAYVAMKDLWEYSKHDPKLIKDNDDFTKLLKANLPVETTDNQAEVVIRIIDHYLAESFREVNTSTKDEKRN